MQRDETGRGDVPYQLLSDGIVRSKRPLMSLAQEPRIQSARGTSEKIRESSITRRRTKEDLERRALTSKNNDKERGQRI